MHWLSTSFARLCSSTRSLPLLWLGWHGRTISTRNPVGASIVDGLTMGSGFALLLCALGAFRELIGYGSLFSRLDMLFGGEPSAGLALVDSGFLLAILPPGAFMSLALAVAAKNALDRRRKLAQQVRGSRHRRRAR